MATFGQRSRGKAPAAILARYRSAQDGITVINCDRGTRFRRAAQGRRIIIRYAAVVENACFFTCIISHLQIADRHHRSVHLKFKRR